MKYVTYKLNWKDDLDKDGRPTGNKYGEQPYVRGLQSKFEGGVCVNNGTYLGYIDGTTEQITNDINLCKVDFAMKEITADEAKKMYVKCSPVNTRVAPTEPIYYLGNPVIDVTGKIKQDIFPTEQTNTT